MRGRVAASTQNQALAAVLFLYRAVLEIDLAWLDDLVRARRTRRVPVVMTRGEVTRVLSTLDGAPRRMASILYGAGLRLLECARLRVKDVDLVRRELTIRSGKGDRDRRAVLPETLVGPLRRQLARVSALHAEDVARGAGWVELPHAFARKSPDAGRALAGQWVFPATRTDRCRETGERRRHHLHGLEEVRRERVTKGVTRDPLRHPRTAGGVTDTTSGRSRSCSGTGA